MKKQYNIILSNYDDLHNPFYGGGGAIAIHELAKRLRLVVNIVVLTSSYHQSKNERVDGVEYRRIGWKFAGPKVSQLLFHFLLPFHVIFRSYDLWIESFTPPISTSFIQLFTKKPVIGLVHMLSGADMERKYKLPFQLIQNVGLKTYKHFIVLHEEYKMKIRHINKHASISVIPNGIATISTNKEIKKHILFMGRIEINQKGIDILLESYSMVKNSIGYPLLIAGNGTRGEVKKLMALIQKNNLENDVMYVGKVDGKIKTRILQQSVAVVIPSRFETYSLIALEALATGIPVVSFDIQGLKWIPSQHAIKATPFSTTSLSQAILKIAKNHKLQAVLSSRGKALVMHQTWEKISIAYYQLCTSLIKNYEYS